MSDHPVTYTLTHWPTLNLAQKPRILSFLSFPLLLTFILLTLCCPLLSHYQACLHTAGAVGELVHGADHHFCSANQLLHPAAGQFTTATPRPCTCSSVYVELMNFNSMFRATITSNCYYSCFSPELEPGREYTMDRSPVHHHFGT